MDQKFHSIHTNLPKHRRLSMFLRSRESQSSRRACTPPQMRDNWKRCVKHGTALWSRALLPLCPKDLYQSTLKLHFVQEALDLEGYEAYSHQLWDTYVSTDLLLDACGRHRLIRRCNMGKRYRRLAALNMVLLSQEVPLGQEASRWQPAPGSAGLLLPRLAGPALP